MIERLPPSGDMQILANKINEIIDAYNRYMRGGDVIQAEDWEELEAQVEEYGPGAIDLVLIESDGPEVELYVTSVSYDSSSGSDRIRVTVERN